MWKKLKNLFKCKPHVKEPEAIGGKAKTLDQVLKKIPKKEEKKEEKEKNG